MNDSVGKTGFTLIEMFIVLVIVILLGAMSIPAMEKVRERYHEQKIVENLHKVADAGQLYIEDKSVQSVDYASLIEADYLKQLAPVNGEDYTALRVVEEGGRLSVVDQRDREIDLMYGIAE